MTLDQAVAETRRLESKLKNTEKARDAWQHQAETSEKKLETVQELLRQMLETNFD